MDGRCNRVKKTGWTMLVPGSLDGRPTQGSGRVLRPGSLDGPALGGSVEGLLTQVVDRLFHPTLPHMPSITLTASTLLPYKPTE